VISGKISKCAFSGSTLDILRGFVAILTRAIIEPFQTERFRTSEYALEKFAALTRWVCRRPTGSFCRNLEAVEHLIYGRKRAVSVSKELRAPHPNERPSKAFQNRLSFEVFCKFFGRVPAIAITLDGQALTASLNHQVDSIMPHQPLRADSIV